MMPPVWTVLSYGHISHEEPAHLAAIAGAVCPPDRLREHLEALHQAGRFVGLEEGWAAVSSGPLRKPLFTLFFEGPYAGIAAAAQLLDALPIKAAFAFPAPSTAGEPAWPYQLSFLSTCDGLRLLRGRLKSLGYEPGRPLLDFMYDNLSPSLLEILSAVYRRSVGKNACDEVARLFAKPSALRELAARGWTPVLQGSDLLPAGEHPGKGELERHFATDAALFRETFGTPARFRALHPFHRPQKLAARLAELKASANPEQPLLLPLARTMAPSKAKAGCLPYVRIPVVPAARLMEFLDGLPEDTA